MKHLLIETVQRHVNLDADEQRQLMKSFTLQTVRRGELWLKEGEDTPYLALVGSGCLYSYNLDEKGNQTPLQFATKWWWITDLYAYLTCQKATQSIKAIETSEIIVITRGEQEKLFEAIPKLERFFRIITENALVSSRKRALDFIHLDARQRYLEFENKHRDLLQTLPQKLIAKYIGMTPEFLSKLRRELIEEERQNPKK
jgi:CRP-like cAMP-binding protein